MQHDKSDINSQIYKNKIFVSSVDFHTQILKGKVFVKMKIDFVNNSINNYEIEYQIPFSKAHNPSYLAVEFNKQKKTIFLSPATDNSLVHFDDNVASDNFSICLNHRDKNASILRLANFSPGSRATITVDIETSLFDDGSYLCFEIPLFEKYDEFLYPNYSIFIQILSNAIYTKEIEFIYNRKHHQQDIEDKAKIKADNISFRSPLILKMRKRNPKPQVFSSLRDTPDIIFFVDNDSLMCPNFISSIVRFIRNFGNNYRFNIVRYGSSSGLMSKTMISIKDFSSDQIEKFLSNESKLSGPSSTFRDVYTNNFGSAPINFTIAGKTTHISLRDHNMRIEGVDNNKTVAICVGSISEEEIITSKKVATYVIDPIQKHNTEVFADKNGFHHLGQFTDFKYGIRRLLDRASQRIRTVAVDDTNQEEEEEDIEFVNDFFEKVEKIGLEKLFDDWKLKGVIQNITLTRLEMLINEVESNQMMSYDLVVNFLNKIGLKEKVDYRYLIQIVRRRPWLLRYLRQFVMVKTFGQENPESPYLNRFVSTLCDKESTVEEKKNFLLSIQSIEFITFQIDESLSKCPNKFKTNISYTLQSQLEKNEFNSENYVDINQSPKHSSYGAEEQSHGTPNKDSQNNVTEITEKIINGENESKKSETHNSVSQQKENLKMDKVADKTTALSSYVEGEANDISGLDNARLNDGDKANFKTSNPLYEIVNASKVVISFFEDRKLNHKEENKNSKKLHHKKNKIFKKLKRKINFKNLVKDERYRESIKNEDDGNYEESMENEDGGNCNPLLEVAKNGKRRYLKELLINARPTERLEEGEKKWQEYFGKAAENSKHSGLRAEYERMKKDLEELTKDSQDLRKFITLVNFPQIEQRLNEVDEMFKNAVQLFQDFEISKEYSKKKSILNNVKHLLLNIKQCLSNINSAFGNNCGDGEGDDNSNNPDNDIRDRKYNNDDQGGVGTKVGCDVRPAESDRRIKYS